MHVIALLGFCVAHGTCDSVDEDDSSLDSEVGKDSDEDSGLSVLELSGFSSGLSDAELVSLSLVLIGVIVVVDDDSVLSVSDVADSVDVSLGVLAVVALSVEIGTGDDEVVAVV